MRDLIEVVRRDRRARVFLATYLQSSLGTGAALVALVVLAYQRLHSPWAIALVLIAIYLPSGLLGPLFGAVADRFSRRWCAVLADVVRAGAFVGLALVPGIVPTILFTFVAGAGQALFSPAILAALPTLAEGERAPTVIALFGSITDLGRTLGPLLAAVAFPLVGADGVMAINGITFAISASVLAFLPFGEAADRGPESSPTRFLHDVREGLRETARMPLVRVVLVASTAIILFASMVNVAELLLVHKLGAGASGFAVLMTVQGIGVVAGSLTGARRGGMREYQTRYLLGALAVAAGLVALAVVPTYAIALPVFVLCGLGNGLVIVHERLIFQGSVPDRLLARAFAVLEALGSWAFGLAYVVSAVLISLIGTRATIGVAGAGATAVWLLSTAAMRRDRRAREQAVAATGDLEDLDEDERLAARAAER